MRGFNLAPHIRKSSIMRQYRLWKLEDNGCPQEITISRNGELEEQRIYRDNLQKANPNTAYWITEPGTGRVVF